jgi:glucosylceramidase
MIAEAAKYAWGTGFHWYEDWKDGTYMNKVHQVNEAYPDKTDFTEGCNERYDRKRIDNQDPKLAGDMENQ